MSKFDYFREAIGQVICEHTDLYDQFTSEQLDSITEDLLGAIEVYPQYSGEECIPNPQIAQIENLEKKLRIEESKVVCPECGGSGRIITHLIAHTANSQCWKCNGHGKIIP